jgi:hypothetical protein
LFNLDSDRGMTTDLSASEPAQLKRLIEAASTAFVDAPTTTSDVELSPEVVEELRALGYLDH